MKAKRFYQRLESELENLLSSNFTYTFTSGATEANNMGIQGLLQRRKHKGNTILVLPIEHASVLMIMKKLASQGFNVQYVPVNNRGIVDLEQLKLLLNDDVNMVVAMYTNNELGVLQPYKQIRQYIDMFAKEALFFSDCVQGIGKFDIDFDVFDAFTASGHKVYGPKGIGFLATKKQLVFEPDRLGGKHQKGRRAGTIPTPLIAGMVKAIQLIVANRNEQNSAVWNMYQQLEIEFKNRGFITRELDEMQSPYIFSCYHTAIKALPLQQYLSDNEIYIGTQSSCSEGANKQSAILIAIGLSQKEASSVIRIGLSPRTREQELEKLITKIDEALLKYGV